MKSISLNLTTEFLESEAVRNLIITGQQNAILTYISIMTIIRRNGCYVHYDDSLLKEVGRMTGRPCSNVDEDIWYLVQFGLFDMEMFESHEILSTRRLQLGYMRRKNTEPIPEEYRIKSAKERRLAERAAARAEKMMEQKNRTAPDKLSEAAPSTPVGNRTRI